MRFRPEEPMHDRYAVSHDFLTPEVGSEVVAISRLINAFFRWEFNSCECLVRGDEVYPIDYANACPDVGLTCLHYYFPWAIKALVKWCVFCVVTGRRPQLDLDTRALLRRRRPRRALLRGEARRLPPAGRRLLRGRALPGVLRDEPGPRRRDRARLGRLARVRRAAASTPCASSTPPTSTSASSRTSAAWSASGCASRAPSPRCRAERLVRPADVSRLPPRAARESGWLRDPPPSLCTSSFRERPARVPSTHSAGRSWSLSLPPAATSSIVRPLSTDSGCVETGLRRASAASSRTLTSSQLLAPALACRCASGRSARAACGPRARRRRARRPARARSPPRRRRAAVRLRYGPVSHTMTAPAP